MWLAPELLEGEQTSRVSDTYSIALIVQFMFSVTIISTPRLIDRWIETSLKPDPSIRPDPIYFLDLMQK